jgi:thymidylate synthase ThyX
MDKLFRIETIASTPYPQTLGFRILQKCDKNINARYAGLSESEYGGLLVESGDTRPLDHIFVSFNVLGFPNYVLDTLTQHSNVTVLAQNERDLGISVGQVVFNTIAVEQVFYFRQIGKYTDKYGSEYEHTAESLERDKFQAKYFASEYIKNLYAGCSEEQASSIFPRNIRQDFIISGSAMAMFQFIISYDRLYMSEEYGQMLQLILSEMLVWMPEVGHWFSSLTKY